MMNASEYKKYHEFFMQNNHGTSACHTFCCILFTVQCTIYISITPKYSPHVQYIYEYLVMVLTMILAHTILAEYIYILNCIIFIILFYELLHHLQKISEKFMKNNFFENDRITFVTSIRGLTYMITVFAILAVDFKAFPRYLAKTERFGYSLMDTGVGLFAISSGLVHKDLQKSRYMEIVKGNLKVTSVMIILGIGRFLSIKQLDYQEHVTEYGVHWNFFFTIAICKIISTAILLIPKNALTLSIICLLIHESILFIGIQDWVFSDSPRNSLISANREGISSCLGYVSIYLFAVHMKQLIITKNITRYTVQRRLVSETLCMWVLTYTTDMFRPTSRTLANAAYIVSLDTILVTIICFMYFITVVYDNDVHLIQVPFIISSINSNGLTYFIIANLLTGAVNLSLHTLFVSSGLTFIILNAYMTMTITCAVYLKKFGLRI